MRRLLSGVAIGLVTGVILTLVAVEVSGGWYTYRLLGEQECAGPRGLGTSTIAPGQPNPCLVRTSRFMP